MPFPVHRLNLRLLPPDVEDGLGDVVAVLAADGFLAGDPGAFVPGGRPMVEGGWTAFLAVERPRANFLSSGMGGFGVCCPVDGHSVLQDFSVALGAWRTAPDLRRLPCGCGQVHDLADLAFAPAAGFARCWLELRGVSNLELAPEAEARIRLSWGGIRVLAHRG